MLLKVFQTDTYDINLLSIIFEFELFFFLLYGHILYSVDNYHSFTAAQKLTVRLSRTNGGSVESFETSISSLSPKLTSRTFKSRLFWMINTTMLLYLLGLNLAPKPQSR
jgi:hypothetical protein